MIGALLRTCPGMQGLKYGIPIILVFLILPLAILPREPDLLRVPESNLRIFLFFVTLCCWLLGLIYLGPRRRFSEFQIMQPVPSSLMLGVRFGVLCLYGLIPPATMTAAFLLLGGVEEPAVWPLAANLGSAVVFASLAVHLPSPGYGEVENRSELLAALVVAVAGLGSAAWIKDPRFGLVLLVVAAALTLRIRRALPPGLLLASAASGIGRARGAPADGASQPRQYLAGWILRKTSMTGKALALGIGCASFAFLAQLWVSILCLIWLTGTALRGLHSVGHLPLSKRRLFPYVALPVFFWIVISIAAGTVLNHTLPGSRLRSQYEPVDLMREHATTSDGTSKDGYHVLVPASHWRVAFGRAAPPIRAPWGEEVLPNTHLLSIWGMSIHFYNPYEISASSSIELVSWQLSRAVEDVYGARISPRVIRERYLERAEDGIVRVRPRYYTFQEMRNHPYKRRLNWSDERPFPVRMDHPGLKAGPPRTPATRLATAFLLCVLFSAPVLFFSLLVHRPPTTLKGAHRKKWVIGGSYFLIFLVAAGFGELTSFRSKEGWDWHTPSAFEVVSGVTFRKLAESLPENGLFCWVIVLLVAVALYLFLEHRFSKMEIPQARQ